MTRTSGADELDEHEWERKFLVEDTTMLRRLNYDLISQGYLWSLEGYTFRVRHTIPSEDDHGTRPYLVTLKGPRVRNSRFEVEHEIPAEHGKQLLRISPTKILKRRYTLISEQEMWVIDVFRERLEGLVIAEIETSKHVINTIKRPQWAGREVTEDSRFANENLAALESLSSLDL